MYIVVSIEESNNVEEMTVEKLQSYLILHAQKFRKVDKEDEHVLKIDESEGSSGGRGRGRGSMEENEENYAGFNEYEDVMFMGESEIEEHVLMALTNDDGRNPLWFLDSRLGNNTRMNVGGKGNVKLRIEGTNFIVQDVYYVAELKNSLLNVGQLQQKGLSFLFKSNTCKFYQEEKGLLFVSKMSANRMLPICEDVNG
ncbi:uncharacterized protein LOC143624177 [Bidens hawaiensis]|uniref:uncharacterized protein LOC143624177 n=1 Tax=Bidens hawaiensis TaxID=980011 RepID=UPI00404B93F0